MKRDDDATILSADGMPRTRCAPRVSSHAEWRLSFPRKQRLMVEQAIPIPLEAASLDGTTFLNA